MSVLPSDEPVSAPRHIDVHAHYFDRPYIDLLETFGAPAAVVETARMVLAEDADREIAERLQMMDASGVVRQVLSMSAATPYFDDERAAVLAARQLNDTHADLCARHPGRFSFFATLPMPHADAARAEIDRAYDELHASGVTFTTSIGLRNLAEPAFAPVFEALNRRGAVIFLHPAGFACGSQPIVDSRLTWAIGAPIEDAICALQLMQADFPRRYPRLKIILPHLGGFIPFLIDRLDRTAPRFMPNLDLPREQVRRFWYDCVNGDPEALKMAVKRYGADRVLFGTDYPYWKGAIYDHAVQYLSDAGLTDDELEQIRCTNATALFEAQ